MSKQRESSNVEEPPEMTQEDEEILDEIWADIAKEENDASRTEV